ncbi:ABC transporter ATP-binding protein [Marinilactibacillus sp. XAAS-LB27]|uniref:ABC transporter ATP-binding protein n=1 Tax=Marinilactibacillus sp. XAAS-LB27 TaxID=3114538 RepID=UPI002E1720E1|nr:ABC transporter ATP-binding protein [Marinilactibacillus sp. XAAS-LB27]
MIECTSITKTFNRRIIVSSISLKVHNGQITSLVGSNGAGKSTIIGAIAGYYPPDSGEIKKGSISIMPDANTMYEDFTGKEFLKFISSLKSVSIDQALELSETLSLSQDLKKKISGYSFGMKKKLSFIQACIGKYDTYILDEPTSGVDEPSAIIMLEVIEQLKADGAGILLTSHNLDELERVSDYVYILDKGKIVNHGSVSEITYGNETAKYYSYLLKSSEAKKICAVLSNVFQNEIQLKSSSEIMLEVKDEVDLTAILSCIIENKLLISEIYLAKKSLRESVYH